MLLYQTHASLHSILGFDLWLNYRTHRKTEDICYIIDNHIVHLHLHSQFPPVGRYLLRIS